MDFTGGERRQRCQFYLLYSTMIARYQWYRAVGWGKRGVKVTVFPNTARGVGRGAARRHVSRALTGSAIVAVLLILGIGPAEARHHSKFHAHSRHGSFGVDPSRESESIVIDADSGRVLSEMNADAITYPASLTKMMT